MNYFVEWVRSAKRELAAIWIAASDQAAVARSANYIERLLMIDPLHEGWSSGRGTRSVFVTPLTADYQVDSIARKVKIVRIHEGNRVS